MKVCFIRNEPPRTSGGETNGKDPGIIIGEDVQKLKSVPKRRSLHKREIVRELKEFGAGVYEYDPLLSDDMIEGFGVKALDIGRAREVLGWAPVVGLREGLGVTIKYFEEIL